MKNICIIACDAFSYETNAALKDKTFAKDLGCKITMTYLSQKLHIDFEAMKEQITSEIKKSPDENILLLYGYKCHPDFAGFLPQNAFTMPQKNCIHALTNIDTEENPRSFYLTPMQILNWRKFFGFDTMSSKEKLSFREKFNHYCTDAIFTDTGSHHVPKEAIDHFSIATGLPIIKKEIPPDIFKNNLSNMIKKVCL